MTGSVGMIAVQNVVRTSKLLVSLFGWKSVHGGSEFDILMSEKNVPTLLLHDFNEHEHDRFKDVKRKSKGVGLSFYVFVRDLNEVYNKVNRLKLKIVEPMFLNENSKIREFTFQIEEGYQFSVCESDNWLYSCL